MVLVDSNIINVTSSFAKEVFIDYYNGLIGNKQAEYMANLFLSEEAIDKLINGGAIFKLVMDNDLPIAFTEYIIENDRVFLSKLYVKKDMRNRGIGKMMLNDCISYAKRNNINKIYLTVNKHNTPSFDIYVHEGFKIIDSVVNDIGQGYVMDDYIMELNIN